MGKFWYEGFTKGGAVHSGEIEADNREEVTEILREKGVYPQAIKEVGQEEIKPVLPQRKTSFEEELGFIDSEPRSQPSAEEPLKEKASEEFAEKGKEVLDGLEAKAKEHEKCLCEQVQEDTPKPKTPLEETSEMHREAKHPETRAEPVRSACSSCESSCGNVGTCADPEVMTNSPEHILQRDTAWAMQGVVEMCKVMLVGVEDPKEEDIERLMAKMRNITQGVFKDILYDFVKNKRYKEFESKVIDNLG